jgi:hypothetical protein
VPDEGDLLSQMLDSIDLRLKHVIVGQKFKFKGRKPAGQWLFVTTFKDPDRNIPLIKTYLKLDTKDTQLKNFADEKHQNLKVVLLDDSN